MSLFRKSKEEVGVKDHEHTWVHRGILGFNPRSGPMFREVWTCEDPDCTAFTAQTYARECSVKANPSELPPIEGKTQ